MQRGTFIYGTIIRRAALTLAAVALALAAALVLTGCGDGDDTDQAAGEPAGAEATPPAAPPVATPTAEAERPRGFLGQRGIYASFPPADLDLYRALLPPQFDMPDQPQVVVFVADYYDINIPLAEMYPDLGLPNMVPYLEGAVLLQSQYLGRTGWHVITMPVDDDTANKGGRLLGFPKYVADEITLDEVDGGWEGGVVHEGRTVLHLSFTPAPGATPQEGPAERDMPLFQLIPPSEGPQVNEVNSVRSADSRARSLFGTATVEVDPEAEWAGLIPEGSAGAMFREMTGASNLVSSTPE